ncbi:MAG: phosphoribosylamine--glycine ligase [Candidatus Aenigmarchaeota archaeon]|nr:phosphoribosylamine--glycine ligase [Candidatus Aenigmarchaeota archaeon]
MKVLVVGGGGREHAIAWKLKQELYGGDELYVAPGNAGTEMIAQNVPIQANNVNALAEFAKEKNIDMTFVGPEEPLVLGIVDSFQEHGLSIVGPTKAAAKLEGSKIFSEEFMIRHGIRHPYSMVAKNPREAMDHGRYMLLYYGGGVIKADGLAAGKGVAIYHNERELRTAIKTVMGKRPKEPVLVQQFVKGQEASFIFFTDGENVQLWPHTQDHKQIFDNDQGPNTGGMGAYARAPVITPEIEQKIMKTIVKPTLSGMADAGKRYRGIMYIGLIISNNVPYVIEYNCRGGDPETQPAMALLQSSLLDMGYAINEDNLNRIKPDWSPRSAVTVVLASQGYPSDEYKKHLGKEIFGLDRDDVIVFHAGTSRLPDGKIVNSGGRVIGVTTLGNNIQEAINRAYAAIGKDNDGIYFDGMLYRTDIGAKALFG